MKEQIVLDTSVLIAGLHSQLGASYQILKLLGSEEIEIFLSVPLVLEYEAVALRMHKEIGLSRSEVGDILDYLCSIASLVQVYYLWRPFLSDPADDMVLELAVASDAAIVTHNVSDFRGASKLGVAVLSPKDFLQKLRSNK